MTRRSRWRGALVSFSALGCGAERQAAHDIDDGDTLAEVVGEDDDSGGRSTVTTAL